MEQADFQGSLDLVDYLEQAGGQVRQEHLGSVEYQDIVEFQGLVELQAIVGQAVLLDKTGKVDIVV